MNNTKLLKENKEFEKLAIKLNDIGNLGHIFTASSYLKSIMYPFNFNIIEMGKVVDFLNHIVNTNSVTINDIGEGLIRIAPAINFTHDCFEEILGLLVASIDITRNNIKSSKYLWFLSLKLHGLDGDGKENSVLLLKLEKQFNKYHLSLKNNNNIKSTYGIIKSIYVLFKQPYQESKLTYIDKFKFLKSIVGERPAEILYNIINNFALAERVVHEYSNFLL